MIRLSVGQLNSFNTRSTLRGISSLLNNLSTFQTSFSFNLIFFTGARLRLGADAYHSHWLDTAYKEAN
ncbi:MULTISPECIES: hypothetical protein [Pantoea]|jgi:hypothetical protein|uniref:Uncharacterized protein n=1 Tax=Candidatus Pantoea symbiotica TaxID=1884370 RepID=A0A1I3T0D6_9GAMM|nr:MULTISPECIES: hypothetical protein [Pantoea]MRS17545.1 hypothetical protein [Enterobacteriaceae bacterium RIT692]KAJ9432727.1 hypothetical protein PMI39_010425 [Pantoea sp. YR343]MEA5103978.1 hypothetical protein [Pantoea sp. S18]UVC27868.1 hypothetical protein NR302_11345 [Pantoea sp. SOD02]SFJ64103.1 hypothetical protein SAMN05518863_102170 [Pantoea symbiotica]